MEQGLKSVAKSRGSTWRGRGRKVKIIVILYDKLVGLRGCRRDCVVPRHHCLVFAEVEQLDVNLKVVSVGEMVVFYKIFFKKVVLL